MSVSFECCVLSGGGLCKELISHPEESHRLWCVTVCDPETSQMRRPWPTLGFRTREKDGGYIMQLTGERSPSSLAIQSYNRASIRLCTSLFTFIKYALEHNFKSFFV